MTRNALLLTFLVLLFAACADEGTAPNTGPEVSAPEIQSITADKLQILYGGKDPAILTCNATGGNLSYVWEVDLGDIIPLNPARSRVSFNGSACCVGEKVITCTVSNSLGSASKSIVITILEEIRQPEIIVIEKDKAEISVSAGETVSLLCYAIGGDLGYTWESDCGNVVTGESDRSRATFTATSQCLGERTITCSVSNEKGIDVQTIKVTVVE